ncbi:hypothetical protein Ahy_B10g105005 [Arachis hypogaea]|uniref:Ubiquitin-like protease family profile domain-containing protein n=1 Tax=Arachis hypogaea TaxID=3818 RepID=A0A444X6W4_ARAHY|nr:hypothetical protein Ahy_B10g105005 [Arachis hypogaea]
MVHSFSSPSKKTQTVKFRVTFQTEETSLIVAKISRNHQQKIELSINNLQKKRKNITQGFTVLLSSSRFYCSSCSNSSQKMAGKNQPEKNQTKDLKCATHLLSEKFRNMSEEKKAIVRDLGFGGLMHIPPLRVHHQILKELANSFKLGKNTLETGYGSFKDRLMFKRIFILYIQMAFLLPTTINKISTVHLAPIFKMDTITEGNWGAHVLNFIIKEITDYNLKKKKAIDGCLFTLMIVYFHLSKNKDKKGEERPPEPWIANWTREQLVERMRAEMEEHMASSSSSSEIETTESEVHSTSESETEEDSEDSTRKQPIRKAKKIESKKRKKIQEDSDSESESNDETQSKKKKVIVEDSSPEQAQSYHGSEIRTEELDEFLRKKNEKSAAQGEKEADMRSTEGHYVSSETVPIQVCLPLSQTTTVPEIELTLVTENEPTPVPEIEPTPKKSPSEKNNEGTTKSNLAPEDDAALIMMARTASYVPKKGPTPSFSLGLTDSSQEEAATQEGAETQDGERAKTPETPKLLEQLGDLIENIASDNYILSKIHLASLAAETHIEAEIVSAMCLILNQQKIKKFQEEIYCLPPDIVNMAIENHPERVFLQPKTNKPFRVEDYPMFIPFLDLKKLASHRYGAPLKRRDKDKEIEPPYINISSQKTIYDCAIYVMKWLEIIQLENIKRLKYEWDNWTQDEVDHFRVEYASRILFHEMNQDKAEAIRGSNAIRLSKPFSLLLSPYCQIDSNDIDID